MNVISNHPFIILAIWWVGSAAIGAMPAPQATDGKFYVWFFKFANTLAANVARAYSTTIEKSPNFQAAVTKLGVTP